LGLALVLGAFGASEAALRYLGVDGFPLYLDSKALGYVPAPSQSGSFMGRKWAFNSISMGVKQEFTPSDRALLLIGDSIVLGGNSFDQAQRLGPKLSQLTGRPVWPISAGSCPLDRRIYQGRFASVIEPWTKIA
jgi:hypothetical protein